jgi:hypothetical protein
MFFADPTAAFANLRTALRPGGELAFICWQELGRNPWCTVPLAALAAHVQLPPPPPPGEPGPFAFGDARRVSGILAGAGFSQVDVAPLEQPLRLGGDGSLEHAVRFALEAGPASRFMKDVSGEVRARVQEAVGTALRPFAGPEGVRLGGACWVVTARNAA